MISKHEMSNIEAPQPLTIPEHLICPITQLIFLQPVTVFPTGRVYEKEIIVRLLQEAANKGQTLLCPLNREPITGYAKAYNIASAVEDYLKVNANVRNQQYQRESSEPETIKTANSTTSSHQHGNNQQVANDAALARAMQEREMQQRDRQSAAALRQQREREQRARESQLNATRNPQASTVSLTELEKKERDHLLEDIQNLIYALGFETGPQPRGRIDNFSLLFFALIEKAMLEPLPWQKIKVAPGPKPQAIYNVLKAAIASLKEMNPQLLENAKTQHKGVYDVVKTVFAGELSLNQNHYTSFAKAMGTINNQPGYLADQILKRTSEMIECVRSKHLEVPSNQAFNM
ncbi:U-box domain [Legionella beliardensis]|uniref:U-box domain n=1 Tax=Legionella beliardensis TaxID=91822 RepID=A0A378I2F0_9GAMM|nr:U-box domain-containing protein [Legionella beliardensis]STX28865.1 U-box domain [Legionella beliardensis]